MFRSLTSGGKQRGHGTCKANTALQMETTLDIPDLSTCICSGAVETQCGLLFQDSDEKLSYITHQVWRKLYSYFAFNSSVYPNGESRHQRFFTIQEDGQELQQTQSFLTSHSRVPSISRNIKDSQCVHNSPSLRRARRIQYALFHI